FRGSAAVKKQLKPMALAKRHVAWLPGERMVASVSAMASTTGDRAAETELRQPCGEDLDLALRLRLAQAQRRPKPLISTSAEASYSLGGGQLVGTVTKLAKGGTQAPRATGFSDGYKRRQHSEGNPQHCQVTVVLPVFQRSVPEPGTRELWSWFAETLGHPVCNWRAVERASKPMLEERWQRISGGRHESFCFDVHYYHCFEDEWNRKTLAEHLRAVEENREELQRFPAVVGEWSLALGGRAQTELPSQQAMGLFARQQLAAYASASHGFFFWNWRDSAGVAWDFRNCFQQGLLAG
ncbi:unnamed protein product, partial [Effrenium voratum]